MSWYGQKRSERLEIRIEPDLKELLDDLAREKKTNVSNYVRTLLIKNVKPYHKELLKMKSPTPDKGASRPI